MGIRVRLGHYTADEERGDPARTLWRVAAAMLGVSVGLIAFSSLWGGGRAPEGIRDPAVEAAETAPRRSGFASSNWGHLSRGEERPPLRSLDTDLEAPEWRDREVYKELKAMAVYEVHEEEEDPETTGEILQERFKDRS